MMPRVVILAGLAALVGCAPTTKYDWGAYPNALLAYYRDPAERAEFDRALDDAIGQGQTGKRVPPGLFAEAGYEALSHGDTQKAIGYFNREKAAWPESGAFMDRAIAGASNASAAPSQTPTS